MIGLSPLPTGHPLRFQPKWVRPSTGSYPRFSLPMGSSPGFASTTRDSCRRLKDSLSLRLASKLNLAAHRDSLAHSTKGTPSHRIGCSDCSWARGFRRCFTPLSGCFSPFPHGTGSLSVAGECSALEGGPPCFARGFTCPALLWAGDPLPATFRVRGSHPVPPAFPGRSPRWLVCNSGRGMRPSVAPPNNTGAETPARLHARRFGLARFRSPLLPGSRLISLPRGT